MDLGWPSPENGGFSEKKEEKIEKKIENFFEIFFKFFLCHFLIPGENWGENFFLAWILFEIFRPILAQKNT